MSDADGRLRIARDRLIFMGLAVLDQIAENATAGRIGAASHSARRQPLLSYIHC
jgi:hypothetical protein